MVDKFIYVEVLWQFINFDSHLTGSIGYVFRELSELVMTLDIESLIGNLIDSLIGSINNSLIDSLVDGQLKRLNGV